MHHNQPTKTILRAGVEPATYGFVTVSFDCDTASLRQYMNEDNDISSELSESDNVNNTQAHNEQINDELSDLDE